MTPAENAVIEAARKAADARFSCYSDAWAELEEALTALDLERADPRALRALHAAKEARDAANRAFSEARDLVPPRVANAVARGK